MSFLHRTRFWFSRLNPFSRRTEHTPTRRTTVRGLEFGNMPYAYGAFDNFLALLAQAPSAEQEQLRMAFIDDVFSNLG